MTDEHNLEAVARAFCKRMGLDPDELMPMETPRWQVYRHSARHHIAMHLAVKEVLG